MLSEKHVQDVCLFDGISPDCCRYCDYDAEADCFHCVKLTPAKGRIDKRLAEIMEEADQNGVNIYDTGEAVGDNCPGFPFLRHVKQGFDCP